MKTLTLIVAALISASAANAAAKLPDPRVCSSATSRYCASVSAESVLIAGMKMRLAQQDFAAVIGCHATANALRFVCSFRNAIEKGSAVVTWDTAFRPRVKLLTLAKFKQPQR